MCFSELDGEEKLSVAICDGSNKDIDCTVRNAICKKSRLVFTSDGVEVGVVIRSVELMV